MSAVDQEAVKRAYREFIDLMPLTLAIAGLRDAEGAKSFTPEQMEARAMAVQNAFKVARQAVREAVRNG
jgi:hypothetical protein